MTVVHLGLGSNQGQRLAYLSRGLQHLLAAGDLRLVAVSSVYETEPWGRPDSPPYLNAAVAIETGLAPQVLLDRALAVERACGRIRRERWGARTLDIDILLYGDRVVRSPGLEIPHPYLTARAFVLVPLLELDPGLCLPDGRKLASFLAGVSDQVCRPHLPAAAFLDSVQGVQ